MQPSSTSAENFIFLEKVTGPTPLQSSMFDYFEDIWSKINHDNSCCRILAMTMVKLQYFSNHFVQSVFLLRHFLFPTIPCDTVTVTSKIHMHCLPPLLCQTLSVLIHNEPPAKKQFKQFWTITTIFLNSCTRSRNIDSTYGCWECQKWSKLGISVLAPRGTTVNTSLSQRISSSILQVNYTSELLLNSLLT